MKQLKAPLIALFISCSLFGSLPAQAGPEELSRAENATEVLREIIQIPEDGMPGALLGNAAGIAVIPGMVKAGFVVGGRYGKGLLSVRGDDGVWSQPSFIRMAGGSVGFQGGVQSTDVVLVFKTRRSVEGIVNGTFTLGADASVAAGPVGREAKAATDAQFKAEIYSYSRSRGLFAGVALDGSKLSIDHAANADTYGADATPRRIFAGQAGRPPVQIIEFVDALEENSAIVE